MLTTSILSSKLRKKEKNNMIETVNVISPSRNLKLTEDKIKTPFYNVGIATVKHGGTSRTSFEVNN